MKIKFLLLYFSLTAAPSFAQIADFRIYGSSNSETCNSFIHTADGGYAFTGSINNSDILLLKTNNRGDSVWQKTYYEAITGGGYSIKQTSDNGFIILGSPKATVIKVNQAGDIEWKKVYQINEARCISNTNDEGYLFAGETFTYDSVSIIKIDRAGNVLWQKNYAPSNSYLSKGYYAESTRDSGYIVAGYSQIPGKLADIYIIKTNKDGDTIWTKTYGDNYPDQANCVKETRDGNYFVTGRFSTLNGDYFEHAWLLLLNSDGDTIWTKKVGIDSLNNAVTSGLQTKDGGYIAIGNANNKEYRELIYLIKLNSNGDLLWEKVLGEEYFFQAIGTGIIESEDGGYILCGYSANTLNDMYDNYNIFYATTDQYGNLTSLNDEIINNIPGLTLYQNYPNPFNPSTTIEFQLPQSGIVSLKIYDVLGREVVELINEYKYAGRHKKQFDGEQYNLSSGVYFYSLSIDRFIKSKIFTFLK